MWRAAIRGERRPRDDHVVQRVARGNADRAGRDGRPARRIPLPGLRRAYGIRGAAAENAYSTPRATGRPSSTALPAAAEDQGAVDAFRGDAAQLGVLEVDDRLGPGRQPERVGAVRTADREQLLVGDHPAATGLSAADPLELAQLLERIDSHVRVGADAQRDPPVDDARHRQEAVAEFASVVGQAQIRAPAAASRSSSAPSAWVACTTVVRSPRHPSRSRRAIGRSPCSARLLLDLPRLLVGVNVQRQRMRLGVGAELAQRVGRAARTEWGATPTAIPPRAAPPAASGSRRPTPAGTVGCRRAGSTQRGRRSGCQPPPRLPPPPVPPRGRGSGTPRRRYSRSPGARGTRRRTRAGSRRRPARPRARPFRPARAQKSSPPGRPRTPAGRHGNARRRSPEWSGSPSPYPFSVFRRWLPNALTIARLVLVPVFIVLIATSDGGFSWPAAIVFAVAGVTDQIDGFLARRLARRVGFRQDRRPARRPAADRQRRLLLLLEDRLPWPAAADPAARPRRAARDAAPARARLPLPGEHAGQDRDLAAVRGLAS